MYQHTILLRETLYALINDISLHLVCPHLVVNVNVFVDGAFDLFNVEPKDRFEPISNVKKNVDVYATCEQVFSVPRVSEAYFLNLIYCKLMFCLNFVWMMFGELPASQDPKLAPQLKGYKEH